MRVPRSPLRMMSSSGTSSRGRKQPRERPQFSRAKAGEHLELTDQLLGLAARDRAAAARPSASGPRRAPAPDRRTPRCRSALRHKGHGIVRATDGSPDCCRKRCSRASACSGYCRRSASSARVVASARRGNHLAEKLGDPLAEQRPRAGCRRTAPAPRAPAGGSAASRSGSRSGAAAAARSARCGAGDCATRKPR